LLRAPLKAWLLDLMDTDPDAAEPESEDGVEPDRALRAERQRSRAAARRQRERFDRLAAAAADVIRESPCTCSPAGLCAVHRLERVLLTLTAEGRPKNRPR
jgi:hypothetical protein